MTGKQGWLAARWERQLERFEEVELKRARRLPTWRTRRRRRQLSLLVILGNLMLLVGASLFVTRQGPVFFGLWFGGALITGTAHWLLRILTGKMSGGFSLRLDEREREMRHRVTYVSYQILVGLMMVGMVYSIIISNTEEAGFRIALMLTALLLAGTTSAATILGWTLPDDDPEDFTDFDEGSPA
ncbi:hypothetical protein [Amycolatopsis sp. cmx-11-12]|uniref:hypothetical protein n=1 Tax=Amycolatopsis sp. cmx-11-12 TaxID=2785795 RepID=UPI003917F0EE